MLVMHRPDTDYPRRMASTEGADNLFGAEHVRRYRETDGEVGHDWHDTSVLILTTRGRQSGEERSTPLIYQPYGDDYLIVASKGGSDEPPAWYLNLDQEPEVELQIKGDRFPARARTANAEEKPEMWRTMTATWPAYDDYQARTSREIPVDVLERRQG
jgi:deazaflavin-dependent oxidoreductase (nitroreductase family)